VSGLVGISYNWNSTSRTCCRLDQLTSHSELSHQVLFMLKHYDNHHKLVCITKGHSEFYT
jgi:hypothetical protein